MKILLNVIAALLCGFLVAGCGDDELEGNRGGLGGAPNGSTTVRQNSFQRNGFSTPTPEQRLEMRLKSQASESAKVKEFQRTLKSGRDENRFGKRGPRGVLNNRRQ